MNRNEGLFWGLPCAGHARDTSPSHVGGGESRPGREEGADGEMSAVPSKTEKCPRKLLEAPSPV